MNATQANPYPTTLRFCIDCYARDVGEDEARAAYRHDPAAWGWCEEHMEEGRDG